MKLLAVKFGTFALAAGLVLVILWNTMVNSAGGESVDVRADFSSVSGLRVGDDVRAGGVRVGRVDAIDLVGGDTARVTMGISEEQTITDTTGVVVRYQNLLGQRYLALTPGEEQGSALPPEQVIPTDRTSPGFDLTALLNGFEPLFETLDPEQTNQLATSVVQVLQGEAGTVESLLAETAELTSGLAQKEEVINRVVTHLTPVLENLVAREDDVTATVEELEALMSGLAEQRTAIGESIEGIGELSQATASLVEETRPDAREVISALRETSAIFADNDDALADMFAAVPRATGAFARPMSYGTWLNMYICNLGVEVSDDLLINVGGTSGPYSQVCR
ncbi:MCE family protein [Aeromicrobium sp. CTD01-1L150]|uniref:MCE family protein n=1 Tax=Aeromicrobium sp. CTD01-1L150 TaxID=3341830 RepID=UPI0035C0DCBA